MRPLKYVLVALITVFLAVVLINQWLQHKISEISLVTNFERNVTYILNNKGAIEKGFMFPNEHKNINGMKDNWLQFTFNVHNPTNKRLFYKIYYQNESYKFKEAKQIDHSYEYNTLSSENFYGSWANTNIGFKELISDKSSYTVTDSFRIIGNPRNEAKFFGKPMEEFRLTEESVLRKTKEILNNPEWINKIKQESMISKVPVDELIYRNATWVLMEDRNNGPVNHRWKRNLRLGTYSAMVVICTFEDLLKIPSYIRNIGERDPNQKFINPYYFFKYGDGKQLTETIISEDTAIFHLQAAIKPGTGIFVEQSEYPKNLLNLNYQTDNCGSDSTLFYRADIEQFFHGENKDFVLKTIPLIKDVASDEYTIEDYTNAEKNSGSFNFVTDYIRNTDCPCTTVSDNGKYILIKNPGATSITKAKKENVGIRTRHGFTYGKFTAKIKFPELINQTNVWNGLTNAFWLLYHGNGDWNVRRYSDYGYYAKGNTDPNAERKKETHYSEIDFEIVKTSEYWPGNYYKTPERKKKFNEYNGQKDNNVMVTVTNWDLANKDPKKFFAGFDTIMHGKKVYEGLRWDDLYQALTIRTPFNDDEMFKRDYFYFQIEWKPTEIIWRVGPEKNQLREVGYMDNNYTNIPNNQMKMVVTQEYHLSKWWPPIPFKQELIPFPKTNLEGKIFELTVE